MQPQYGTPQPAAGGKKFTTQMQIIVAAAVAVVLIIGAGIVYSSTGGDDKGGKNEASSAGSTGGEGKGGGGLAGGDEKAPANTKSQVAFQLPEPVVGDTVVVKGSWLTDKAYVKSGVAEINAYDQDKGTKLWTVPLAGEMCSASRHMSEDQKAAIVFAEAKPSKEKKYPACNQVGVVDLVAGKLPVEQERHLLHRRRPADPLRRGHPQRHHRRRGRHPGRCRLQAGGRRRAVEAEGRRGRLLRQRLRGRRGPRRGPYVRHVRQPAAQRADAGRDDRSAAVHVRAAGGRRLRLHRLHQAAGGRGRRR
ncbi:hypothetical protein SCALM49S_04148 [Streptomyces californicus]